MTKHAPSKNTNRSIHRIAYSVVDDPNSKKSRWLKVGVSFLNRDGSETVMLDAVPLSGKLILQPPKEEGNEG